jgi:hypothetical protein
VTLLSGVLEENAIGIISPFLQTGIHVLFPLNREFYGLSFSDPSGSRIEPSLAISRKGNEF